MSIVGNMRRQYTTDMRRNCCSLCMLICKGHVPYGNCLYKGLEILKYSTVCVCVGGGRGFCDYMGFDTTFYGLLGSGICMGWGDCGLTVQSAPGFPVLYRCGKACTHKWARNHQHEEILENALNSPCWLGNVCGIRTLPKHLPIT